MVYKSTRLHRITKEITKHITLIIHFYLRDPRLKSFIITISEVKISKDLSYAKVFVSLLKSKKNHLLIMKILQNSSGYIKKLLSKRIKLRIIPNIFFIYDHFLVKARRLIQIVENVNKKKVVLCKRSDN